MERRRRRGDRNARVILVCVRPSDKIYRTDERRRAADVISREVNVKEAARLLRLIPGGGTGGIMWKLLMMAHKLNRTGSSPLVARLLHRMPQDNNAAQEEEERGGERLLPHTSLEFNVNQGEVAWVSNLSVHRNTV